MSRTWDADEVKRLVSLADVVRVHTELEKRGREWWGRCPFPGHEDQDPSFAVNEELGVWRCWSRCGAGNVIQLVMKLEGLGFAQAVARVAEIAGLGDAPDSPSFSRRVRVRELEPEYWVPPSLDPKEVLASYEGTARPVTEVEDVARYLEGRGLDPTQVESRGLARALPEGVRCPNWMWSTERGGTWSRTGYRLLLPTYDTRGEFAFVRGRQIEKGVGPKALNPTGSRLSGASYACSLARKMLAGASRPARLIITEGGPDFLSFCLKYSDADESAPAVIGLVKGAWCNALAERIPSGTQVALQTHPDDAGRELMGAVKASLDSRCSIWENAPE